MDFKNNTNTILMMILVYKALENDLKSLYYTKIRRKNIAIIRTCICIAKQITKIKQKRCYHIMMR